MNRNSKSMPLLVLFSFFFSFSSCEKDDKQDSNLKDFWFETGAELEHHLKRLTADPFTESAREEIEILWDSLKARDEIPFVVGDSVLFLYFGDAQTVSWAGDFNGWNPGDAGYQGKQMGHSPVWILKRQFPADARLDYKIVLNNKQWILDPANSRVQMSGFGPNSELRMPQWEYPKETLFHPQYEAGMLHSPSLIVSKAANLNYTVQYRVYTPAGYDTLQNLPVVYVTDGHEYADPQMGSMVNVLDNLIAEKKIQALVAVFVDPRDPGATGLNRRMIEYASNPKFVNFLADELVPEIDAHFKTNTTSEARMILGTSMGGLIAAYTGIFRPDVFRCIGIHSPAFDNSIIQTYRDSSLLPLKIYMSTGVIYDTQDRARNMKTVLEAKGYPLLYREVNQGHSWGNWRGLIDEPLMYFFPY